MDNTLIKCLNIKRRDLWCGNSSHCLYLTHKNKCEDNLYCTLTAAVVLNSSKRVAPESRNGWSLPSKFDNARPGAHYNPDHASRSDRFPSPQQPLTSESTMRWCKPASTASYLNTELPWRKTMHFKQMSAFVQKGSTPSKRNACSLMVFPRSYVKSEGQREREAEGRG